MSAPFFSIAVPCCDVAKYVRECFDSVVSQSFRDWEIVAYVETSGDDTEAIVREYAAREPRIRVFAGPRSGSPSVAHNVCTDEGRGEYMICLDGDDTIAEGSLQRLHDKIAARPGSDIYPCAIRQTDELADCKETIRDNYPQDFNGELTGVDATILTYRDGRSRCPMRQLNIYSIAYLKRAALKCVPGLRHEDNEFTLRALYHARRVIPLHEAFYIYRKRAGSITTDSKAYISSLYSFAEVFRSHFEFCAKVSTEISFKPELYRLWAKAWLQAILLRWFNPHCVKHVPRFERVKTLGLMFKNGFANASKLMHHGRAVDKIEFTLIRAFLAFPFARPSVEKFFALFYFRRMGIGA